jgi:hypothetical protein
MLVASIRFLPEREGATADGWQATIGDEQAQPAITYYATLTLAQNAVKAAFQADPGVDGYFLQAAQASVLVTNSAAVTTAKNALRTADGL